MQGDVAQIKYGSIRETSSHLVTEYGGISGLFRGLKLACWDDHNKFFSH